ncbi:MAG: type II secretion system protein, partial [Phycisphaerae bacterium]
MLPNEQKTRITDHGSRINNKEVPKILLSDQWSLIIERHQPRHGPQASRLPCRQDVGGPCRQDARPTNCASAAAPYYSNSYLLTPNFCKSRKAGFTLIELLVVISIIVILMAILLPAMSKIIAEAHGTATQEELSAISSACLSYEATFNAYPGPFSEADISNQDVAITGGSVITGTQNMLIGLMGTMYNAKPNNGAGSPTMPANAAYVTITDTGAGAFSPVYVTNPLGSGPI